MSHANYSLSSLSSSIPADILIVDDVLENIHLLSNILESRGYETRKATSGKMALTAIATTLPDLILLDIRMPDLTGYEVGRQLKADPKTAQIPIIFLSAADNVTDKAEAFRLGGADYITKPFQVEEVLVRVQTQLTIRELQHHLESQHMQLKQALESLKIAQDRLADLESIPRKDST